MRVYDLSKQLNIPSRDLLDVLKKQGFVVKSHMSALSDDAIAFLQKKFNTPSTSAPESTRKEPMQESQKKTAEPSAHPAPVISKKVVPPSVKPQPALDRAPMPVQQPPEVKEVVVELELRPMSVSDVAVALKQSVNDVIVLLLKWGIVAPKNVVLKEEIVERLARHYNARIIKAASERITLESTPQRAQLDVKGEQASRLPIIVVVGHVDHGKTTLLDFIRKTRVVAREKGGITQHLGAYEARTSHGNLVFLDTPGHEAFSKMRQRGIRVADLAILVVAADDGVMPQTVEVIKQLKALNIPVVVAMNKVDKADKARLEVLKRQLAQYDLLPEEWGGQIICLPISAKTGQGVDELVEMVALQTQLLELKTVFTGPARCFVLEAKVEKGRGAVATLICQQGTLKVGDYFVAGLTQGRVSSIKDSYGKIINEVGPSVPVLVAGFKDLPNAGDLFSVAQKHELKTAAQEDFGMLRSVARAQEGAINLVIKVDTNSSKEALLDAIDRLSSKSDRGFNVVHSAVGNITESDIDLAAATSSDIIGLHIKAESNAKLFAQQRGVRIHLFDVIYKLLESLEQKAEREKVVEKVRTKIGEALVRKVFDIKGIGVVAGSYIQDGRFSRDGYVIAWRGRQKLGEGRITSLQRDKKTVKEVHSGYECGFVVEGITNWREDDRVECYLDLPKQP